MRLPYQKAEAELRRCKRNGDDPAASRNRAASPEPWQSEEWLANLYRRAELFPAMTPLQERVKPVETEPQWTQLPKAAGGR